MRPGVLRRAAWSGLAGVLAATGAVSLQVVAAGPAQASITVNEVFTRPASGSFLLEGHGWGHGRGMSQNGAQGAATIDKTADQITATYYPSTARTVQANTAMRVKLSTDTRTNVREFIPASGQVMKDLATGATVPVPTSAALWRVVSDSAGLHVQYDTSAGTTRLSRTYEGPLTVSGTTFIRARLKDGTSRDYRTSVRVLRSGTSSLMSLAVMSMEGYLLGVVPRESLQSWDAEALRSQAIAARSYSTYKRDHVSSTQKYDICDTTMCQVFSGSAKYDAAGNRTALEYTSTSAAVNATAGVVRTYNGGAIFAEYSASNGGHSTAGSVPYLVAKPDPWDGITGSSSHRWSATLPVVALEKRYGPVDSSGNPLWRLTRLTITERDGNGEWGGRVLSATVTLVEPDGTAHVVDATGSGIYASRTWPAYSEGLRSRWFRVIPTYAAVLVSRSSAPTLVQPPGAATGTLKAVLKNTGSGSWPVSGLHLALASPAGGADPLAGGSTRPGTYTRNLTQPGATSVVPGDQVEFAIGVDAAGLPAGTRSTSYRLRIGTAALFGPLASWSVRIVPPSFTATVAALPQLLGTTGTAATGAPPALFADGRTVVVPRQGSTTLKLSARNTGNVTWPAGTSTPVMLGTSDPRNRTSASTGAGWVSGIRAGILNGTTAVSPGGTGTFDLVLNGNSAPVGVTAESFEPAWQGESWIGGAKTQLVVVRVDSAYSRAAVIDRAPPTALTLVNAPTGRANLVVRLRNVGGEPWTVGEERLKSSGATSLAYRWPSATTPPPLARNVTRPGQAAVHPGEVGEWVVPLSAARTAPGTVRLGLRAVNAGGYTYGPAMSVSVKVLAAQLTWSLTYVRPTASVPADGVSYSYFKVRNTGNVAWPVGGALRSTVLASSSPSRASTWYSATRPGSLSRNLSAPGSALVRPGEVALFVVRLAGNGRAPLAAKESFGMSWDGWRSTALKAVLAYRVV